QEQIRQMTGTIEQLQFRNQQLEQALARLQAENQQLGGRAGPATAVQPPRGAAPMQPISAPPVASGPSPVSTPVTPGRRADVFDPSQNPNAPGAPGAAGAPGGVTQLPPPPPRNPNATGLAAVAPPSNTPKDQYDLAYGY